MSSDLKMGSTPGRLRIIDPTVRALSTETTVALMREVGEEEDPTAKEWSITQMANFMREISTMVRETVTESIEPETMNIREIGLKVR